jgi:hypothetical protein
MYCDEAYENYLEEMEEWIWLNINIVLNQIQK